MIRTDGRPTIACMFGGGKVRPGSGGAWPVAKNDEDEWDYKVAAVRQRIELQLDSVSNKQAACKRVGGHVWNAPSRYSRRCEACGTTESLGY